jgi:hypothetical protein
MRPFAMAVAVFAVVLAGDISVTGRWDVQTEVMGNAGSAVCALKQEGSKIAGTCNMGGADQAVTGEIADQKVTFRHAAEYNGQTLTIIYNGKFESATVLSGEVNVQPFEVGGTFKATKRAD